MNRVGLNRRPEPVQVGGIGFASFAHGCMHKL